MFPTRLTPSEREQLTRWLSQQAPIASSPKSAEIFQRFVDDMYGRSYDVGGEFHGVVVGPNNIPIVINQQRAKILDCGHVVTSLPEVSAVCDFGHVLCHRERLYKCSECRRNLCEDDLEEEGGKIICPICKRNHIIEKVIMVIGILLVFAGILVIFGR